MDCLVCHRAEPEDGRGYAVLHIYLHALACIGACDETVDRLNRVYDRSKRGRWRPLPEVRTLANGARCGGCGRAAS